MKKTNKNKLVDNKQERDSSKIKNSLADEKLKNRVSEEIRMLMLGGRDMTIQELNDTRQYAKKRTDLNKNEKLLTLEQKLWKTFYVSINDLMSQNMKIEDKEVIDRLIEDADSLDELKELINKIIPIVQEIESELIMQRNALIVFFDKNFDDSYKIIIDKLTTDLVDPNKFNSSERIEKAEQILKIIDINKELLYRKELLKRHEKIHTELKDLEIILDNTKLMYSTNKKNIEFEWPSDLFNNIYNWVELTKDLYSSRTSAILAVKNNLIADEFLPKYILEKGGEVNDKITDADNLFEKMSAVIILINKANDEENEISKKRDPLSEELLGKSETYANFSEESKIVESPQDKEKENVIKRNGWFVVIGLSIVALSWGIWTAIGIFVLGSIMINLISVK